MSDLITELEKRFGEHRVTLIPAQNDDEIELLKIELELRSSQITLLMTHGLSHYEMPTPDQHKAFTHQELFFCLPNYWEPEETENPSYNWPFEWIHKLSRHVVSNNTWYGPGHTFSNGNPATPLSPNMKMEHLILLEPILLEEHLVPVTLPHKTIQFLSVCPIYDNELEYKLSKGFFKFLRKYRAKNNSEMLDDFRESALKSRFKIF